MSSCNVLPARCDISPTHTADCSFQRSCNATASSWIPSDCGSVTCKIKRSCNAAGTAFFARRRRFSPSLEWKLGEAQTVQLGYRFERVEVLKKRGQWKAGEMLAMQRDVYSSFDHFLAQRIIAAFDRQKPDRPQLAEAAAVLRSWNGQMESAMAAPLVTALVYQQLRKLMIERVAAGLNDTYQTYMARSVVERMLRERPAEWFPDYDALLLRCLTGALDEGSKIQGTKVSLWQFGQFQELQVQSPVAGRLPLIGKYFNLGPVAVSGSPATVKQYTGRLGPSLRMVIDLADLEHSYANLATGESGQRLSSHYSDQWEAYLAGRSFPMQFGKIDARDVLVVRPGN